MSFINVRIGFKVIQKVCLLELHLKICIKIICRISDDDVHFMIWSSIFTPKWFICEALAVPPPAVW
jgi:hypothetical protein